jgi:hypothetical protein
MSKNTVNKPCARLSIPINAYMNPTRYISRKTLSRIAYKRSSRAKRYLDTPLFHVFLTLQANSSLDSQISWTSDGYGILLVLLVYLRVDFYMRHPNATGRILREATGTVARTTGRSKNRFNHYYQFCIMIKARGRQRGLCNDKSH